MYESRHWTGDDNRDELGHDPDAPLCVDCDEAGDETPATKRYGRFNVCDAHYKRRDNAERPDPTDADMFSSGDAHAVSIAQREGWRR